MCVKEKTAVLSQQGWTWQSADRPFKNKKYEKCMEQTLYFSVSVSQRAREPNAEPSLLGLC